ncbi:hypothetical protein L9F63_012141, partial [Diploptera punctata]
MANRTSIAGPTWLLFTSSSLRLEDLLAHVFIPFNCVFLVAREGADSNFSIVDLYQVNRTQPIISTVLASWNPLDGITWQQTFLYERRHNLNGQTIRAITYNNPPLIYSVSVGNEVQVSGAFGKIWSLLEEELNFT